MKLLSKLRDIKLDTSELVYTLDKEVKSSNLLASLFVELKRKNKLNKTLEGEKKLYLNHYKLTMGEELLGLDDYPISELD